MEKNTKILIVDDEEDILDIYHDRFVREGFDVVKTTKGEEVYGLAEKHQPALILLDLMLNGINGYQVLKKLKTEANTKSIPVLILSNVGHGDGIEKGILTGADDYIVKVNFTPKEVVEKVKSFLKDQEKVKL